MILLGLILRLESVTFASPDLSFVNLMLRLVLSAIVLVSGIGKMRDMNGTRQAMSDFGLPSRFVHLAARVLPGSEIILAGAILIDSSSSTAAGFLCLLFLMFAAGIGNLLRQDKAPPCHCFGVVHSAPVTLGTFVRALLLSLMAATVWCTPQFSMTSSFPLLVLVSVGFVGAMGAVDRRVRLQVEKGLHNAPRRLKVGQRVPAVKLRDGRWLESLLPKNGQILLVLTAEKCTPCKAIEGALDDWSASLSGSLPIIKIRMEGEQSVSSSGSAEIYINGNDFQRFLCPTPGGLLVDHTGALLAPPVSGAEQLEALIRLALSNQLSTSR